MESQSPTSSQPINIQLEDLCQSIDDELSRIKQLNKDFEAEIVSFEKESELLLEYLYNRAK